MQQNLFVLAFSKPTTTNIDVSVLLKPEVLKDK